MLEEVRKFQELGHEKQAEVMKIKVQSEQESRNGHCNFLTKDISILRNFSRKNISDLYHRILKPPQFAFIKAI